MFHKKRLSQMRMKTSKLERWIKLRLKIMWWIPRSKKEESPKDEATPQPKHEQMELRHKVLMM